MVWYEEFYTYLKYASYIFFFISFFQLNKYAPKYLDELNIIIKVIICVILLYRFNPISTIILTDFDRRLVFDSALYLLFSSLFIDFYLLIKKKYSTIKKYKEIKKYQEIKTKHI
jgi:hypothetical protein